MMDTREQLIEALLYAQQGNNDPRRPVYADDPRTQPHQRAHALVLELFDQVRPHAASIPELWDERHLADVQLPTKGDTDSTFSLRLGKTRGPQRPSGKSHDVTYRGARIVGLSSLDAWRYRTAPRAQEAPGRTSVTTGFEEARVWMPPTLMSGARAALDEALNELGWLPGESANDFDAGMGDGV